MKARDLMLELIVEIRKVTDLIAAQINPAAQTIELLNNLESKQNAIELKINAIVQSINTLESNYKTLLNTKAQWEELDQQIQALENELGPLRELYNNGDLNKNPANCDGMLGYEAESTGDGLLGKYYNNEDFLGKTTERTDELVDYSWENECPAPGVNEENFSIKWSTWLRIPTTGKYTFYTESDDGNSLYVNGQKLISHFMGASSDAGTSKVNSWLDSDKGNYKKGKLEEHIENRENEAQISPSGPVYLNGGMKYKLDLLMYHSVHNENNAAQRAFSRLYWSSEQIERTLIKKDFFYTSNKIPPLKISGLDPAKMVLSVLKENANAFKDTEEYKVQDVPFQFQNKPSIRLNIEFADTAIKLSSTSPVSLYFAIDANRVNPLPPDFEDTHEGLSVLKILKTAKAVDNKVKAAESTLYKVYRKKFQAGKLNIPLLPSKKTPTHRMIIFYSLDSGASNPVSCGGETILISNPTSPAYQSCETSSKFPDEGWSCESGLSGKMIDTAAGMWSTNGQGIGAWMDIKLKAPHQITKLEVKDRGNSNERNAQLELSFGASGKEPVIIDLKNIDEKQEFPIPATISSEIKITIKSVYGTINNGGSFNIYGIACADPNQMSPEAKKSGGSDRKKQPIKLACSDTFRSKDDFERMNIKEGDSAKILCEETCALSNVPIYGDGIYSEDSSICKAAFHAGVLQKAGDKVKLTVVRGESFYKSGQRNGIKSAGKQVPGVGIQFQVVKSKENTDNLKLGMKVDVYDGKLQKWLPGDIENIEKINKKTSKLTIKKEGYGPETNEILQWPNPEKVTYCGEMIKERNCDANSSNPNSLASEKIRITFGPGPNKVEGYLLDEGKELSKKGELEYGWSRDVSNLARARHISSDPLIDNLILFPPDPKSKWCEEKTPVVTCENIDWSIKLDPGKYNVKVTVGDIAYKVQYDLKVNEKKILTNKILDKNQFFTTNDDITILDGVLRIVPDCEGDCKFSWSRIDAIEISRLQGIFPLLVLERTFILTFNLFIMLCKSVTFLKKLFPNRLRRTSPSQERSHSRNCEIRLRNRL